MERDDTANGLCRWLEIKGISLDAYAQRLLEGPPLDDDEIDALEGEELVRYLNWSMAPEEPPIDECVLVVEEPGKRVIDRRLLSSKNTMLRYILEEDEGILTLGICCYHVNQYEWYLGAVRAARRRQRVDKTYWPAMEALGVDLGDPPTIEVMLSTGRVEYARWVVKTTGGAIAWIAGDRLAYDCLRVARVRDPGAEFYDLRIDPAIGPPTLLISSGYVSLDEGNGYAGHELGAPIPLVSLHIAQSTAGKLRCRMSWLGDGSLVPLVQLAVWSVRRFAPDDEDVLARLETWLARLQELMPVHTITPGGSDATMDALGGEPSRLRYLVRTDLYEYRDWLMAEHGAVEDPTGSPHLLWLRQWHDQEEAIFLGAADTSIEDTDRSPWGILGDNRERCQSGSSYLVACTERRDWRPAHVLYLRRPFYWAQVALKDQGTEVVVEATVLRPSAEHSGELRALRRASMDRFGGQIIAMDGAELTVSPAARPVDHDQGSSAYPSPTPDSNSTSSVPDSDSVDAVPKLEGRTRCEGTWFEPPKREAELDKWIEAYQIMREVREEYRDQIVSGQVKETLELLAEELGKNMYWRPDLKTVSRIRRAGDMGCLE